MDKPGEPPKKLDDLQSSDDPFASVRKARFDGSEQKAGKDTTAIHDSSNAESGNAKPLDVQSKYSDGVNPSALDSKSHPQSSEPPQSKEILPAQRTESKPAPTETSAQHAPIRTEQEHPQSSAKAQPNEQTLVQSQSQRSLPSSEQASPTDKQVKQTQPLTVEQSAGDVARPAKPIEPSSRSLDTPKQSENSKAEVQRPAERPAEISKSENQSPNGQSALKSISVADLRAGSLVSLPIPEHRSDPVLPTKQVLEDNRKAPAIESRPATEIASNSSRLPPGIAEPVKLDAARDLKVETLKLDGNSNAKVENTRLPQVSPTEGKIAEAAKPKTELTENVRSPFEGKIPEGKIADGKQSEKNDKSEFIKSESNKADKSDRSEIKTEKGDTKGDKITGNKSSGGSSGPSAFIQFIESQAGIRGGKPASDKTDKSDKSDKPDKSAITNKTDKSDKTQKEQGSENKSEPSTKNVGNKIPDSIKIDATKSGADRTQASGAEGAKIAGVKLDGIKSSVDGLLGLVDTVKENIKSTLKGQVDRAQVSLKPGEFVAFTQKDRVPPLKSEIYSSAEIIAVLIPSHLVKWSIVRAPNIKPSDVSPQPPKNKSSRAQVVRTADQKPSPKSPEGKTPEQKPFDINNPPDKSRPFIQLHGVDSEYSAGRQPLPQRRPVVKIEQPEQPPKSDAVKVISTEATPWLDVPDASQKTQDDQSSTRPAINAALAEKRKVVEAQEHTLPTLADESSTNSKPLPASDLSSPGKDDRRTVYVNKEIDAQESTWSSDDESTEPVRPMHRYAYVVRPGDTVESVAVTELNDLSLAPLLYGKNRKYVLSEIAYGVHPFLEGAVIDLPTPAEIAAFRQL